ncbi:hypothetical protein BH09ACT6_BH09ACT6_11900 [soil metagenome]
MLTEKPRLRPRIGVVIAAIGASLVLMAGTFVLGLAIRGADSEAYENSLRDVHPVATVELHSLAPVTTTATAVGGASLVITAVKPAGANIVQVTNAPLAAGAPVKPGDVLIALSGRPVFAVPITGPFFRDLSVGDEGPDVASLNSALWSMGYDVSSNSDEYDRDTVNALATLYDDHGFQAARAFGATGSRSDSSNEPESTGSSASTASPSPTSGTPSDSETDASASVAPAAKGTRLPFAEVAVVTDPNTLVTRVLPVLARPKEGDEVIALSASVTSVTTRLDALEIKRITAGQTTNLVVQGSGTALTGVVSAIGAFTEASTDASTDASTHTSTDTSGKHAGIPGFDVTVELDAANPEHPKPGDTLAVTFNSADKPSPAVPSTALNQDGLTTFVRVRRGEQFVRQDVTIERFADGWALLAETPSLVVGDSVRLG